MYSLPENGGKPIVGTLAHDFNYKSSVMAGCPHSQQGGRAQAARAPD